MIQLQPQSMQSLSVYKTSAFLPLASAVLKYQQNNPSAQPWSDHDYFHGLKTMNDPNLIKLFEAFRMKYISNKDFFPWNPDTNGLSIYPDELDVL